MHETQRKFHIRPGQSSSSISLRPTYHGSSSSKVRASSSQEGSHYKSPLVNLITNAYNITMTNEQLPIYHYRLIITLSSGCKNLPERVLHRNFVSSSIRKVIMDNIVPTLLRPGQPSSSVVINSSLDAIYSISPLEKPNNQSGSSLAEENDISFEKNYIKSDLIGRLSVDICLRFEKQFRLNSTVGDTQDLLTAILHHQLYIDMIKFGANYFNRINTPSTENRLDLISQHTRGICLSSLRKSIAYPNIVIIHSPHCYITQEHRLIDLLASFILGYPVEGIELLGSVSNERRGRGINRMREIDLISGHEDWWDSFCSILEGFKCQARGLDGIVNMRFSLTPEPASSLTMVEPTTESLITVQEFYNRNNIQLTYPNLPCLTLGQTKQTYFPFELCSLIAGQKSPIFRLSANASNDLIALNKQPPQESKNFTSKAKQDILKIIGPQLNCFGVELSRDTLPARGSNLKKPALQFLDQKFQPERDFWESGMFYQAMHLVGNWCVVNTTPVDPRAQEAFFFQFIEYCRRFGFKVAPPHYTYRSKQELLDTADGIDSVIGECLHMTDDRLKFIMFVIDSNSTQLNRMIHLTFDEHPTLTATCLRVESIMNQRKRGSIYRTFVHKLNTRLGGTNVTYHASSLEKLNISCGDLMVIGLDVTHPDNELNGVSIVGCAYTYSNDLFKHKSVVWPQQARMEIIGKIDALMKNLLQEYIEESSGRLPKKIIVYRDGVSHEEFEKVRIYEVDRAQSVISEAAIASHQPEPSLSYVIAQKRHTMRFYQSTRYETFTNPPSGTLIDEEVVFQASREFYLYSHVNQHVTARPLHYHVLVDGIGIENLQKLTYFLCFNFGKCSATLSMPSSLRYAHNAAYDARNRVIAAREFSENKFYTSKFFC